MKYIFSQKNLNYFVNDALKNKEGKTHLETLAICVGKLHQENCIVVDELIFPTQTSTNVSVEDKGLSNTIFLKCLNTINSY